MMTSGFLVIKNICLFQWGNDARLQAKWFRLIVLSMPFIPCQIPHDSTSTFWSSRSMAQSLALQSSSAEALSRLRETRSGRQLLP